MIKPAVLLGFLVCSNCIAQVTPEKSWATKQPAEVGIDRAGLVAFSDYLGGRGCVVRHGYMVYTWGDAGDRADVASACKPMIAHFLFKALEEGRIKSFDEPAIHWEPCLKELNPRLGFKDRRITLRHLATQTSCYGVTEAPGTAYDYNDWQMALFFDVLFHGVYGVSSDQVDERFLRPFLVGELQCEDNPTFTPFRSKERAGRLGISVRDFARFGLLYLRKGKWRNRQLIGEAHVKEATTSPLPLSIPRTKAEAADLCPGRRTLGSSRIPDDQADHDGSYSYLWWINGIGRDGQRHWPDAPPDTFGAFGHNNGLRALVVVPSLDVVISWNDTTLGQRKGNPQNEAFKILVGAVHSPSATQTQPSGK